MIEMPRSDGIWTPSPAAVVDASLGAGADRPLDGLVRADLGGPLLAVRGEELREAGGRARLVGAVHHGDRLARELHARVELGDCRVVPVLDLPEEDVGDRRAVELEPALDAVEVVRDG